MRGWSGDAQTEAENVRASVIRRVTEGGQTQHTTAVRGSQYEEEGSEFFSGPYFSQLSLG